MTFTGELSGVEEDLVGEQRYVFPTLKSTAYYLWQKGIEIIGPNRATMFIQLMPLFSAVMAIIIFKEKFELYHFVGATFIVLGIYLSNRKKI